MNLEEKCVFIEIVECERDKANCELANANNVFENGQTTGLTHSTAPKRERERKVVRDNEIGRHGTASEYATRTYDDKVFFLYSRLLVHRL